MLNCPKFLGFETFPVLTVEDGGGRGGGGGGAGVGYVGGSSFGWRCYEARHGGLERRRFGASSTHTISLFLYFPGRYSVTSFSLTLHKLIAQL